MTLKARKNKLIKIMNNGGIIEQSDKIICDAKLTGKRFEGILAKKNAAERGVFTAEQRALFARFRPGVTQTNGAVKHQFVSGGIAAVEAEIAFAFELIRHA